MKYFAIRYFLADLETLTKKPKYNYGSVRADICEEFESTETSDNALRKLLEYVWKRLLYKWAITVMT